MNLRRLTPTIRQDDQAKSALFLQLVSTGTLQSNMARNNAYLFTIRNWLLNLFLSMGVFSAKQTQIR
jgi:hypothetical protein